VATTRTTGLLEGTRPTRAAVEAAATAGYALAFTVSVAGCLFAAGVALATLRARKAQARPEGVTLS